MCCVESGTPDDQIVARLHCITSSPGAIPRQDKPPGGDAATGAGEVTQGRAAPPSEGRQEVTQLRHLS